MREMHLFAGAGGGILGGLLLGHTPVCAVEIDPYCRQVLKERQADGSLPEFPIYEDVRSFDGKPWRGKVDVVCGGFPCQPWSSAGKQLGTDDPRHLWPEMARIIEEVRPTYVFAENVSLAAFEDPWRDLRRLGYRVPPALCLSARDVGAPHLRKRWWLLASNTNSEGLEERQSERSNTREKLATIWHRRRSRGSWHRPSFRTGGKGKGACKACRKEAWDRGDRPKGRRKGQKRKKNGPTLGDVQSVQSTSTNRLLALYEAQERAAMHWERAAIQIDIDRELARRRTA